MTKGKPSGYNRKKLFPFEPMQERRPMKAVRVTVILVLTAAVLLAICAPSFLTGVVPQPVIDAARMDEFPLLNTCGRIARGLLDAIGGGGKVSVDIVTRAIGDHFFDELISLVMVAMLTIPISLLLGFLLYRPLYQGAIAKAFLYVSLNLCSVMLAWVLYRQVYFRLLIEGLIQKAISDQTWQTVVNYVTQTLSALLVGAVAIKIAVAALAATVVLHKIILPIIGTFVRTLLFAFLVAQIMLLQANPAQWTTLALMMGATLILSALSDAMFGS